MLIALLATWLLVGGRSGPSPTATFVDRVTTFANTQISDKEQRKAVFDIAGKLKKAGKEEGRASTKAAAEVVKISRNREATSEDSESTLSQLRGYSIELQHTAVLQRFTLKSKLTREQWVALHSP